MRMIDADALLKAILGYPYGYRGMIESEIENQQTVDAMPVVRCKDCKHYKKEIKCVGGYYSGCDEWLDEGCESPVDEDGYCSYAERKDNETD